jgi:hypothetical protein
MKSFCETLSTPLLDNFNLEKGDQVWFTDTQGKYKKYEAKIGFELPVSKIEPNWKQQLAHFFDKWWWLIPLPLIFYDWFVN